MTLDYEGDAPQEALDPGSPFYPETRSRAYGALVRAEVIVSCVLMVAVFFLILIQVFSRYVLNSPLPWSEELSRFLFIWLVFASATFVMARRRHISVVLFGSKRIGARAVSIAEALASVIVIAGCAVMAYGSIALVGASGRLNGPVTGLPMSIVYSICVVSYLLMAAHAVVNIVLALKYPKQFEDDVDLSRVGA
ncbi:TRAP transporter small permease [Ruicaihuangia caeni]|uniref:TRAP transporter small permease n=1 Tax=Ruicaihuangia caeni TaxID=3042517 RepID=A0AAW6T610_9MICO|nr:TRAP transporter small permease [Klugiella sp. YN-L-19]MDI2098924.1 TRAP transporter small permease [Klugiella sp. YN-L-19]